MSGSPPNYDWPIKWPEREKVPSWALGLMVVLVALFALVGVVGGVWTIARFFEALALGDDEAIRNVGFIFLAVFGAPFVIWRAIVAQGNLNRSRDRDYADLFTKAVEQLGATREDTEYDDDGTERKVLKPNVEVRLGAIYALQRISQDSERDHIAVMETLCAYVRENSPASGSIEFKGGDSTPLYDKKAQEIQAILDVIGRRAEERINHELKNGFQIDLRRCNLQGYTISLGNFGNSTFSRSMLDGVNARFSILRCVDFYRCSMISMKIEKAVLDGANLRRANISSIEEYTDMQLDSALGDSNVMLPPDYRMPNHWKRQKGFNSWREWVIECGLNDFMGRSIFRLK